MADRDAEAPEVVCNDSPLPRYSALEASPFQSLSKQQHFSTLEVSPVDPRETVPAKATELGSPTCSSAPQKPPYWKRRWFIVGCIFLVPVVVVAAVLGGLYGQGERAQQEKAVSDESTATIEAASPTATPTPESPVGACNGTVCPQILSAVFRGASYNTNPLWIFARGTDQRIHYIQGNGEKWATKWTILPEAFQSPPSTAYINPNAAADRTLVWAVDRENEVKFNELTYGTWSGWRAFGRQSLSPVSVVGRHGKIYIWMVDPATSSVEGWSIYPSIFGLLNLTELPAGSVPAGTFRLSSFPLFEVYTIANRSLFDAKLDYNSSTGELEHSLREQGGNFVADPVVVWTGDRTDIFAISTDGAMHHGRYLYRAYTETSLDGSFESVPSVLMTGDDRVDVVALGTDHLLKHRTWLADTGWEPEWEDLGVFGNSAPLLFRVSGVSSRINLMVIGHGSELNYTSWEESDSLSWKGLGTWESAGGKLTTDWMPPIS